jgi:hypothetical protein
VDLALEASIPIAHAKRQHTGTDGRRRNERNAASEGSNTCEPPRRVAEERDAQWDWRRLDEARKQKGICGKDKVVKNAPPCAVGLFSICSLARSGR